MKYPIAVALCILIQFTTVAQETNEYITWDPATSDTPVLEGQAWPNEVKDRYDRFPARAERTVDKDVWDLSKNSAGLIIKFKSNATTIKVSYQVDGGIAFPHMPATGVSGLDLYGIDRDGKWFWCPGRYSFRDTITYSFSNLLSRHDTTGKEYEYRLYLPLYNTVKWMNIQYPKAQKLTALPVRQEKPVVVYGTSIAQGGCATRTGLAWTAILERNLARPLINLGFSGNGHLDPPVLELMAEIEAKVYVLDCLPNLIVQRDYPDDTVTNRILNAVKVLQTKRPNTPIILSEHSAGGPSNGIDLDTNNVYEHANNLLHAALKRMNAEGVKNIYLLSNKDINFNMYSTVDGEHPTDLGMEQNAVALEKLIRKITSEPVGNTTGSIPTMQNRDYYYYWATRHQEILSYNKQHHPAIVFIGNSITHMWGGEPLSSIARGTDSWDELFKPRNTVNMGFGYDRTENVLWRIYHDELDGFDARQIFMMIGTNNLGRDSIHQIVQNIKLLFSAINVRQPKAELYAIGIFPRRGLEKVVVQINKLLANAASGMHATFIDPGRVLLNNKGQADESLFEDGLHPNAEGYRKLAMELKKVVK
jgi:lysophospholipase L1-like esterase